MNRDRPSIITTLPRCLRLRCPACGLSPIFQAPFKIKHHCPGCGALYQREEGFFTGAILANMVTTEAVVMAIYLVCLLSGYDDFEVLLATLLPVALLFPVAFYHHSWSLWLGVDHVIETLPKYVERGRR